MAKAKTKDRMIARLVRRASRLPMPFFRKVILLDGFLWTYNGIPFEAAFLQCLRRGIWLRFHPARWVDAGECPADFSDVRPDTEYKGVSLLECSLYSICNLLEVHPSELDWSNEKHVAAIRQAYFESKLAIDLIEEHCRRYRGGTFLCSHGFHCRSVVTRRLASRFGIKVICIESTFDPDRMICEFVTGVAVNATSAKLVYTQALMMRRSDRRTDYISWLNDYLKALSQRKKIGEHASPPESYSWPPSALKILYVGQVYTDASIIFAEGSPSPTKIIRKLVEYANENNAFVFCKFHPKENTLTRLSWRKLTEDEMFRPELMRRGISWDADECNRFSTASLIEGADLIVTVNSQGALEAIARGKAAILFGSAFYSGLGFTHDLKCLSSLRGVLDKYRMGQMRPIDLDQVALFMHTYLNYYCINESADGLARALRNRSNLLSEYNADQALS